MFEMALKRYVFEMKGGPKYIKINVLYQYEDAPCQRKANIAFRLTSAPVCENYVAKFLQCPLLYHEEKTLSMAIYMCIPL